MILVTATNHFNSDIQRSRDILTHATAQQNGILKEDLLRTSWMMAAGALDAFFCDAYGDLIARVMRAKIIQPNVTIPDKIGNLRIPAEMVIGNNVSDPWLWRMLAREIMEKDNVLSIGKIKELFNHFFRSSEKLFQETGAPIDRWILHRNSKHRLFGITKTDFRATAPPNKNSVKKSALDHLQRRFEEIFQRRHDCIHNCDRPRTAIQRRNIRATYISKVIDDIEFLVNRCTDEFRTEFRVYLRGLGFSAITRNQVT